MVQKKNLWLVGWVTFFCLLVGCGRNSEPTIPQLPTLHPHTEPQEVADGFDLLGDDIWNVGGIYFENKLIDISDSNELTELYDTTLIQFFENGTFVYWDIYNARGKYTRQSDERFILETETRFVYEFSEDGSLIEEIVGEGQEHSSYLVEILDENTLSLKTIDPITGKPKSDLSPLIFERMGTESEYISNHKTGIS